MPFAEDLSQFYDATAGFAVVATWGGYTASVIFNAPSEEVLGGQVVGTDYSIRMPTASLPGIGYGQQVVVAGKGTFTVREVRSLSDGGEKLLILAT